MSSGTFLSDIKNFERLHFVWKSMTCLNFGEKLGLSVTSFSWMFMLCCRHTEKILSISRWDMNLEVMFCDFSTLLSLQVWTWGMSDDHRTDPTSLPYPFYSSSNAPQEKQLLCELIHAWADYKQTRSALCLALLSSVSFPRLLSVQLFFKEHIFLPFLLIWLTSCHPISRIKFYILHKWLSLRRSKVMMLRVEW